MEKQEVNKSKKSKQSKKSKKSKKRSRSTSSSSSDSTESVSHWVSTGPTQEGMIYWTPGSTGIPKIAPRDVPVNDTKAQVVFPTLSVWRWKTGFTNLSTDSIRRMFDESGFYCRTDKVIYKVAWPLF